MSDTPQIDPTGPLGRLSFAHGVEMTWTEQDGRSHHISSETAMGIVSALIDEPISTERDVEDALASLERTRREQVLEPVIVAERGRLDPIDIGRAPDGAVLLGEDGSTRAAVVSGTTVDVGESLGAGLYTLTVEAGGSHHVATVIATPDPSLMHSAPPFAVGTDVRELRDRRGADQGRGHIGLVGRLADLLDRHGVGCVSVPSLLPHRPIASTGEQGVMTRRGWAPWIVEVDAAPGAASLGLDWNVAGGGRSGSPDTHRAHLARYADLVGDHPALRAELDRFLVPRPHVSRYARFLALGETLSQDWRRWPAPWRSGDLSHAPVEERRELYHQVAQWLAHRQIHDLVEKLADRGQQLEMHLDIAVHPEGYDNWNQPHLFSERATTGRPPNGEDPGLDWGRPAARASVGHSDGYRSFAAAVRHQLVTGLLHVPSVEVFHRSWWIPLGGEPADGAWVRQPGDELLAVVGLEAHREGATVVSSTTDSGHDAACGVGRRPPAVTTLSALVESRCDDDRLPKPIEHVLADPAVVGELHRQRTAATA